METQLDTNNSRSKWIGTSNRGFAVQAVEELRRLFTGLKFSYLMPAEVFMFDVPMAKEEALEIINRDMPMFLRHLQPVDHEIERAAVDGDQQDTEGQDEIASEDASNHVDLKALAQLLAEQYTFEAGEKVTVQVRKSEGIPMAYSVASIRETADRVLHEKIEAETVVRGADRIISIYVVEDMMFIGVSRPQENVSDWSGGAIRFRKEDGQVSRAKFKLLEAEYVFSLDFTQYRSAVDLGAAPGGWTSLLLERGLDVTAVDTGTMDPALMKNPKLKFIRKNASSVKLAEHGFDLMVCDMSWHPKQTAGLLKDLLHALKYGGTVIVTVKLMNKKAFQTVRDFVRILEPELQLQGAKQLFHNREELTLFLMKK
ncbi:SAM-dependent methyltransferase [Paenibacillus sp. N1-5-1-14]|uniref:SAM-dependent methyltransferase n=1 Tax=Paenibacillus radicibacter TaxID=2972488 RepID=UPI002158BE3F|nr:SAM-dependent methyltransferase [Paenibacillus radicibacter]MCR8641583.1 SAM-dependent methyltransferase [Paenibacillus radicibacter]